jgi:hypothetical protein
MGDAEREWQEFARETPPSDVHPEFAGMRLVEIRVGMGDGDAVFIYRGYPTRTMPVHIQSVPWAAKGRCDEQAEIPD